MLLLFESPGHLSVRVHVHLVENPLSAVLCTLLITNNSCGLEIIGSETNMEETNAMPRRYRVFGYSDRDGFRDIDDFGAKLS